MCWCHHQGQHVDHAVTCAVDRTPVSIEVNRWRCQGCTIGALYLPACVLYIAGGCACAVRRSTHVGEAACVYHTIVWAASTVVTAG